MDRQADVAGIKLESSVGRKKDFGGGSTSSDVIGVMSAEDS